MVSRKAKRRGVEEANRLLDIFLNSDIERSIKMEILDEAYKILLKVRGVKPDILKLFYCKKCRSPLYPGFNAIYRVRSRPYKHISIKCLRCGRRYRKGFK